MQGVHQLLDRSSVARSPTHFSPSQITSDAVMSRRRSARVVTSANTSADGQKDTDHRHQLDNTIRVVSDTTRTGAITASKLNLLDESIQTLDMDWQLSQDDVQAAQADPKVARKPSRLRTLARAASGASGAIGSTVSTLGKRSRDVFESGKDRLQQQPRMNATSSKSKRTSSRLANELKEFLPDPEPVPANVKAITKPRKKLPKGWSYVVPDAAGGDVPTRKEARLSSALDKDHGVSTAQLTKPVKGSKSTCSNAQLQAKDKRWESKGLFAGQQRGFNPQLTESQNQARKELLKGGDENSILPLPMYKAEDLLTTELYHRNFRLPFDVFQPLDPRGEKPQKGAWQKLKANKFIGDAAEEWKHQTLARSQCNCGKYSACVENCWNRTMSYECDDNNCSAGEAYCQNRAFNTLSHRARGNRYDIGVGVIKTSGKGFGVQALRTFEEDQIIMEYVGEIITKDECERRMLDEYKDAECYYLMEFNQSMVIDATKGSIARFVNHSCEPNCKMEQWAVNQKPRKALFAKREIMTGEELTYDYNFAPFSKKNVQTCHCGSQKCRGVIGPKMSKDKVRKSKASQVIAGTKRKIAALFENAANELESSETEVPETSDKPITEKPCLDTSGTLGYSSSSKRSKVGIGFSGTRMTSASTGKTTLVDSLADTTAAKEGADRLSRSLSGSDSDVVIRECAKPVLQADPYSKPEEVETRQLPRRNVRARARDGVQHRDQKLQRKQPIKIGKRALVSTSEDLPPASNAASASAETLTEATLDDKVKGTRSGGTGPLSRLRSVLNRKQKSKSTGIRTTAERLPKTYNATTHKHSKNDSRLDDVTPPDSDPTDLQSKRPTQSRASSAHKKAIEDQSHSKGVENVTPKTDRDSDEPDMKGRISHPEQGVFLGALKALVSPVDVPSLPLSTSPTRGANISDESGHTKNKAQTSNSKERCRPKRHSKVGHGGSDCATGEAESRGGIDAAKVKRGLQDGNIMQYFRSGDASASL